MNQGPQNVGNWVVTYVYNHITHLSPCLKFLFYVYVGYTCGNFYFYFKKKMLKNVYII